MPTCCKVAMQFGHRSTSVPQGAGGPIPIIVLPTLQTMSLIFAFGERRPEFPIPVLNERAVRAAAGVVFFFAIVSFMNAWLIGNFQPTRVFVVAFLIDFTIRIFVNPRFAPSLILGQWMVRKQQPEWVGAPQKRFAWAIGFVLALVMLYLVVLRHVIGPINLFVCAACLVLLFFETAFGICIGCKVYNWFNKEQAQLCPGGVCEIVPERGAGGSWAHAGVALAFVGVIGAWTNHVIANDPYVKAQAPAPVESAAPSPADAAEAERCKVPDFAKAIGHEEKWKLHNSCK
jgi:hypothetical protein